MNEDDRIRNLMMLDYSQLIMYTSSLEELNDINRKEIERLEEINEELGRDYSRANNEFLKLHSIIKEVREYIKDNEKEYGSLEDNEKIILEILDKENKE